MKNKLSTYSIFLILLFDFFWTVLFRLILIRIVIDSDTFFQDSEQKAVSKEQWLLALSLFARENSMYDSMMLLIFMHFSHCLFFFLLFNFYDVS